MKKPIIFYTVGYAVLGITLLLGSGLIWNAQSTIDIQIAEQEEAAKPAEIELTLIVPASCDQCIDGNILIDVIEKLNVRVLASNTFSTDSEDGATLVETYSIKTAPTILVKGEYDKENVRETFASYGGEVKDGTLIIPITQPVYKDLASDKVIGLVDVTYLTDSSCPDCYDATQHKGILESNFGVTIESEQSVDAQSSAGRELIQTYAITQTPTVLISPQAQAYANLVNVWEQIGTIEEDGTFVFRKNDVLTGMVYKDLETGEIVQPATSEQ